jgi:predicted metal-dependent hydrolase
MPPRGSVREAKEFAQKHGGWIAARLRRLPEAAPFADGTVLPLRGVQHRIVHRPGVRGTVWSETGEDGEPRLCVAGQAPHIDRRVSDFLRREALRAARRRHQADFGTRPVEPLGLLLDHRGAIVFVASHPRAAVRAGLSCRA